MPKSKEEQRISPRREKTRRMRDALHGRATEAEKKQYDKLHLDIRQASDKRNEDRRSGDDRREDD